MLIPYSSLCRYGGSNHLCDMYCNGRLEGEADDVRLRVEGPTTDLRSVDASQNTDPCDDGQDVVRDVWVHLSHCPLLYPCQFVYLSVVLFVPVSISLSACLTV